MLPKLFMLRSRLSRWPFVCFAGEKVAFDATGVSILVKMCVFFVVKDGYFPLHFGGTFPIIASMTAIV